MMLGLIFNVRHERVDVRWADREGAVPVLPCEPPKARILRLDPFRRIAFEFPNKTRNFERLRQPAEGVYMIFDSAYFHRGTALMIADAREVSMRSRSEFLVL